VQQVMTLKKGSLMRQAKRCFWGGLPLFNNFGATVVLNGAFYNRGTLILRERWDLDGVVADIERYKGSVFFGNTDNVHLPAQSL
jgi:acyl-CoA synthetase (AMP-forming)/AMP-acid ligase II